MEHNYLALQCTELRKYHNTWLDVSVAPKHLRKPAGRKVGVLGEKEGDLLMLELLFICFYSFGKEVMNIIISPWTQRGYRAPPPPPRILHEWYHFVQETPLINNQDVNAL